MYCYAQPANLRTSTVFVLINYNRELKINIYKESNNRKIGFLLATCRNGMKINCFSTVSKPVEDHLCEPLKSAAISCFYSVLLHFAPNPTRLIYISKAPTVDDIPLIVFLLSCCCYVAGLLRLCCGPVAASASSGSHLDRSGPLWTGSP